MEKIFMNKENVKANEPHKFVVLQNVFITREKL